MHRSYHDKILTFPYRGAPSTVALIRESALKSQSDYGVRELAEHICRDVQARDYVSEPVAIYHFVCQNTRYTRDPRTVELVREPHVVAKQIKAGEKPSLDCDDMAVLICALCMAVGCHTRVVTVAFRDMFFGKERQYEHVFAQAQDPGSQTWVTLDPVAGAKTKEMLGRIVAAKTWEIA